MTIIHYAALYGLIYALILLILTMKHRAGVSKSVQKAHFSSMQNLVPAIVIGLIVLVMPIALITIFNCYSFPNPDTYYSIISSYVDDWSVMPIDEYYRHFPIYVILIRFLGLITGIERALAIVAVHLSALCLLFVGIVILLVRLAKRSCIIPFIVFLTSPIFISSIYLYSYFYIMIPQTFSLWIIVFFFITTISNLKRKALPIVLMSVLGLVHALTIPYIWNMLFISLMLEQVISKIYVNYQNKSVLRALENESTLFLMIVPMIVHLLYFIYSYRVAGIETYVHYYVEILRRIFYQPEKLILVYTDVTSYSGTADRYPFISALGPAFIIAVFMLGLYLLIFKKLSQHPLVLGMMIFGVLSLLIGFTRYYVATDIPSASVARYVNVYGFLFLLIYDIYVLYQVIMKYSNKTMYFVIIGMALVGAIGSLFYPLTIPYRPPRSDVLFAKTLSSLAEAYSIIYFESDGLWYYLGPQISLWRFLDKAINASIYIEDLTKYTTPQFSYSITTNSVIFTTGFKLVYVHGSSKANPVLIIGLNSRR